MSNKIVGQILTEHRILSAPVLTHIMSSIDLLDILAFALDLQRAIKEKSFLGMLLRGTTIADVLEKSQAEPPSLLPVNISCHEVFRELGTGKHRVLLIDEEGDIVRLISQADCVRFAKDVAREQPHIQVCLMTDEWMMWF
jgi:CBS-domain-containing membrane protein